MPSQRNARAPQTKANQQESELLYRRIVVKAGTALLTHGADRLNQEVMGTLVEQIAQLHAGGIETVLVSSGAVAAGRHVLGVPQEGKNVPFKQVLAAAGQGHLMHVYEQLFDRHSIPVAQALLSRKDLSDRLGYLNIRNTLLSLLELRVVPIINENDVVAVDELAGEVFGDNDNLSAMVANLVDADLLVMLGDVDGLYTADPHLDPDARLVPLVEDIDVEVEAMGGGSWNNRGQGGMVTKLESARRATATGVSVVIANGLEPEVVTRLSRGERIGTLLPANSTKMESRKRWMLSGLSTRGEIQVDDGAVAALLKDNRSLLPAGVKEVLGSFDRGDIVAILDAQGEQIAAGIANYSSGELDEIKGSHSNRIEETLGHNYGAEVVHRNNMVFL